MNEFQSVYDTDKAFTVRADLLRHYFGVWDAFDPVSHAILDIAEAQSELQELYDAGDYTNVEQAAFKAAVAKRHAAGVKLMQVLNDRDSWPDPGLGT